MYRMKDRVDKLMGIVTLMTVVLSNIKPTEPLRLVKRTDRQKRNCLDSSKIEEVPKQSFFPPG
jgi:hypothetical protein